MFEAKSKSWSSPPRLLCSTVLLQVRVAARCCEIKPTCSYLSILEDAATRDTKNSLLLLKLSKRVSLAVVCSRIPLELEIAFQRGW